MQQVPYPVAITDQTNNAAQAELHRAGLALVQSSSFTSTILSRIGPAVDVELRSTFEEYSSQLGDEEVNHHSGRTDYRVQPFFSIPRLRELARMVSSVTTHRWNNIFEGPC